MKHWQHYSIEERKDILGISSAKTALPQLAVEKDWWVVMTLRALSMTKHYDLLSFKGGTSLSKGWNLIERFSEDIDIALSRKGLFAISGTSNTQLAKVKRSARHYIVRDLPQELESALRQMGVTGFTVNAELSREKDGVESELRADTHPSVIYINYDSVISDSSDYLLPRVKIEISCLSMDEPVVRKEIRSFISETVPVADDVSAEFNTVVPTRTFLEKIFLLHEEFQREKPRSIRMSRHLYDLERLMDSQFGIEALQDSRLYMEIVNHRDTFNHIAGIDYNKHAPSSISIIPPPSLIKEWEQDYTSLALHFLYADSERKSFEELLSRIRELQERIHGMR